VQAQKKEFDIRIISIKTIEGLLKFLELEPESHLYDLDKNINKKRIDIQGQKPNKILKQVTKVGGGTECKTV